MSKSKNDSYSNYVLALDKIESLSYEIIDLLNLCNNQAKDSLDLVDVPEYRRFLDVKRNCDA